MTMQPFPFGDQVEEIGFSNWVPKDIGYKTIKSGADASIHTSIEAKQWSQLGKLCKHFVACWGNWLAYRPQTEDFVWPEFFCKFEFIWCVIAMLDATVKSDLKNVKSAILHNHVSSLSNQKLLSKYCKSSYTM